MKLPLTMILLVCINTVFADSLSSLTLTDAEMQKLKKYFPAEDTDHLIWKGDPLTIKLPLNQEKRLVFPSQVSVDLKSALNTDQLRLLNNDKSLYLTALKSFGSARLYVTLKESGEVLLIDIVTEEHASNATQYIDIKQNNSAKSSAANTTISDASPSTNETSTVRGDITYVDLIRYAWQQLYAPERLLRHANQYARASMHTQKFVSNFIYGDKVIAFPESSWSSGDLYVTAILLRNKYTHKTKIDLQKDICGDWQSATLYPRSILQSYGDKEKDSTMLFLVSNRPFGDTIGVCHGDA